MDKKFFSIDLKPTQVLVLGFLAVILIGAFLLDLPISNKGGHSAGFIDALFTSTSAVCVTGLAVVNTRDQWTIFGKVVLLLLIQVGGLGIMTITTTMFILLGKKIRLKERLIIQEAMNQYTLAGMVRLIKNVFLGTILIEGIGAFLLSVKFVPEFGFLKGIWMGIFHSVSSFCNAGFDIVGYESLVPYVGSPIVNFTVMGLIILGGLGFTVWLDILRTIKEKFKYQYTLKRTFQKFTLHTKLVLVLTLSLIVFGFVFFFVLESMNPNTLGPMGLKEKLLGSLFQSVTPRTAGYNTISQTGMTDASKFMTIILMFIGGSPAGTAGGIKTVTFGIIFLSVVSVIKAKDDVEAFGKRIAWDLVRKALTVAVISMTLIIAVTMVLTLTEVDEKFSFLDMLFETVSAFGTVGLTLGVTPYLTIVGKLIISLTMFIGRLGPITMLVALTLKNKKNKNGTIKRPEEKVMVG
ncbi:MAG: Trk family potassium uptake protein [Vallitaleaceae bacterium]|nr:Trk family potassium uptake protein [Vallitaleaceae bacterium]